MIDYIYEITAWKNGSEEDYIEFAWRKPALKAVNERIKSGKYDAIDMCRVQVGTGYLNTKETWTLWNGNWEHSRQYIGEDR